MVEVPKTVSQVGIQQRTVEQIVDVPVPWVVEELMEVSKDFAQDRVQQRSVEQTIETSVISFAVKIVEVPVITPTFNTSSTQSKWRSPHSSRRKCGERSPSCSKRSTR